MQDKREKNEKREDEETWEDIQKRKESNTLFVALASNLLLSLLGEGFLTLATFLIRRIRGLSLVPGKGWMQNQSGVASRFHDLAGAIVVCGREKCGNEG